MIRLIGMLFFGSLSVLGCMQHYGTSVDGRWTMVNASRGTWAFREITELPKTNWEAEARRLEPLAKAMNANYQDVSNYAEALAHLGRAKEAITLLEPLALKMPREYAVIANLGTSYELDGQNEKALKYISESLKLNPYSHEETEWVHVKILEAKINMAKDAGWIQSHSVLGYDFGGGKKPVMPAELSKDRRETEWQLLVRALTYQLHERLQFVKAPDVIVADLLFDLGNIFALRSTIEDALPFYDMAWKFNGGTKSLIDLRVTEMKRLANAWTVGKFAQKYPAGAAVGISAIGLGAILLSRASRKNRAGGVRRVWG